MSITLEKVINFLLNISMFEPLSVEELSEVVSIMDIKQYHSEQLIFSEGEVGDAWYVIYDGQVSVNTHKPFQQERTVAVLSKQSIFGEMAILDEGPRSASVVASTDSILLRFPRARFERLLEESKIGAYKLVYGMASVLAERQREINRTLADFREQEAQEEEKLFLSEDDDFTVEIDEE